MLKKILKRLKKMFHKNKPKEAAFSQGMVPMPSKFYQSQ